MGVISPNPVTLLGGVFIHGGQIRPYERYELTLQPFAPI
jgi:hypothetical protein